MQCNMLCIKFGLCLLIFMLLQGATVFTILVINDPINCYVQENHLATMHLVCSVFQASSLSCHSFVDYNCKFGFHLCMTIAMQYFN